MADPIRDAREELRRVGLLGPVRHDDVVPDLVLRSWRRSIGSSVDGSAPLVRYQEVDTDSILCRAAEPVLDRWQEQLSDTGTTLFLGDRAGSIVARRTSDSSLKRRLDRVHAAEGFDYSEESVGTNGLGTSMVERRAVLIQGSQHYHEALARLTCAAAPVCAPSGSVLGSVSLGTLIEGANPLMLSLTREIGQQIEERLRAVARPQDLALAMSFMRFTNSQRPTVVMDSESLLANTPGLPYVNVTSHVLLWGLLNAHDWSHRPSARFDLEGPAVEVVARRVTDGPRCHYVLHFASGSAPSSVLTEPLARRSPPTSAATPASPASPASPVAVGPAVLGVAGPHGSGRATAARALHHEVRPDARLEVLTLSAASVLPADEVGELLVAGVDVLLRRTDTLSEAQCRRLHQLLADHRRAGAGDPRRGVVILTTSREGAEQVPGGLDRLVCTSTLADAPERVPGLVKRALDHTDPHGRHTISPAALQALVHYDWPGNITELVETLTAIVRSVPGSVIERRHLPRHLQQAPPRRHMSLLESAERDVIIRALAASNGNKSETATLLGMGRTTLYRRLRQLGLDDDETSLRVDRPGGA